jgi:hypothetical protein
MAKIFSITSQRVMSRPKSLFLDIVVVHLPLGDDHFSRGFEKAGGKAHVLYPDGTVEAGFRMVRLRDREL